MTDMRCPAPIGFADVVDYWAGELTRADEDRIDEHVFSCADCARELAAAEALARGIAAVAREGRLHTVVTDAILNRLAADGVRIRMFTLEGDASCRARCGPATTSWWRGFEPTSRRRCRHHRDAPGFRRRDRPPLRRRRTARPARDPERVLGRAPADASGHARPRVGDGPRLAAGERTLAEYTLEHGGAFDRPSGAP